MRFRVRVCTCVCACTRIGLRALATYAHQCALCSTLYYAILYIVLYSIRFSTLYYILLHTTLYSTRYSTLCSTSPTRAVAVTAPPRWESRQGPPVCPEGGGRRPPGAPILYYAMLCYAILYSTVLYAALLHSSLLRRELLCYTLIILVWELLCYALPPLAPKGVGGVPWRPAKQNNSHTK